MSVYVASQSNFCHFSSLNVVYSLREQASLVHLKNKRNVKSTFYHSRSHSRTKRSRPICELRKSCNDMSKVLQLHFDHDGGEGRGAKGE